MSSTPQFTTGQLAAARAKAWHQTGELLLTLDAVRDWINNAGIVLFAPRPQHVAAPAPSLVEATLGMAVETPTAAQTDTARSLVGRLVSEGNALPLNLLGGPGDAPDYIVSAQMFSFVFTLRGEKLWKQAPATSGTGKVSPLALAAYELLADRGALTAPELANELGREITEAATLRALHELWAQLRVIPLLQQGDAATMWELTSRRFTKAIKAGANAGQPTALSALVSLYLAQALLATEDEIAAFLSPLASRSRIRDVVHGLTAGRQLEPVVLEGKALLHVPGTLPEFPAAEVPVATEGEDGVSEGTETTETAPAGEERIKRFTRSSDSARGDFKGKPARSFGGSGGPRPSRPAADRERRPFRRDAGAPAGSKPSFTKPWNEDRKPRTARPAAGEGGDAAEKRPYVRRERPAGGDARGPARRSLGDSKPGGFGAKRPYVRRSEGDAAGGDSRPPRRTFDRDSKPGGFGAKRPYVRRSEGDAAGSDSRPPRRSFGDSKPGGFGAKRPYVRRSEGDAAGSDSRPPRRTFDRDSKPGGFGAKRPYVRRSEGDAAGGDSRPPRRTFDRDSKPGGFGAKRPYVRRSEGDAAGGDSRPPRRTFDRDSKPGGFGAKRPYVRRSEGDAAGGDSRPPRRTFDRDNKPGGFGAKRPYVRRSEGDAAGGDSRPPRRTFDRDSKPGGFGAKRPYVRREGESSDRPARPSRPAFGAKRPFGDKGDRPSRGGAPRAGGSDRPARSGYGSRAAGGGFSKRPGGKVPFGSKPGFGKRPAAGPRAPRKPRAEE
ncbi:MAG TPA: hypothetical protein VGN16_13165 [Acidobacteriaceae bacterium]